MEQFCIAYRHPEMISILIESKIPKQFTDLVWDVFFRAKSRGITVHAHFPWIDGNNSSAWYVVLRHNERVVGGLVVKDIEESRLSGRLKVGAIGLVCIDSAYRGQGYAKALLEAAIVEATMRGYDALTLWTQKRDVYSPQGFRLLDDSIFGSIDMSDALINENENIDALRYQVRRMQFPKELGLPPFARGGSILATANAQVIFVEDNVGPILADWSGGDADVSIMLRMLPEKKWRINAHQGDNLLNVLEVRGAKLNLAPSNLQMWLPLKKEFADTDWTKIFRFSVLDRI
jgi:GNAT superfamily N-acetyltransferase